MENIELKRDCEAVAIPRGQRHTLAKGTAVRIVHVREASYTVSTMTHSMYQIDAKNGDALGFDVASSIESSGPRSKLSEQLVWDTLKTVYDPELPVNIVDLGLIYSCTITPDEKGSHTIAVRMAMTSPGCGMSEVLKSSVQGKLIHLPQVSEAQVEVVFDPAWDPSRMSENARLQLGMDVGASQVLTQISLPR